MCIGQHLKPLQLLEMLEGVHIVLGQPPTPEGQVPQRTQPTHQRQGGGGPAELFAQWAAEWDNLHQMYIAHAPFPSVRGSATESLFPQIQKIF